MTEKTDLNTDLITNDEQFLDELLTLAGFNAEQDDFELLKEDLRPLLSERIMLKIYAALPSDADRQTFDEMMTKDEEVSTEKLYEFLTSRIPNFNDFMTDMYLEFQKEYLEAMKA
ncbi:MAG: DUF3352 domain-containing protein [Candidatus Peribacteria bacterium]|jgi:wyosine [tRNA(Phe)-imidazoG37] synthetase (radical SAM superfamily)|nr:DUF3352 domain-containing protein [Candidatus Peribacteria bacterium]